MNIIVPIKQVPDTGMNLQIQNNKIDATGLKWVLSPYDEFALEEALKLKSSFQGKLFVITLGPERAKDALLTALALGADEAFHLLTEKSPESPLATAQALSEKISEIPDISLIFCGKLSTDSNNFAVPQMLAGLLNWSFISNVSKLQYQDNLFKLSRECGGGIDETVTAKAPLLLSADKGLNEPRYPSLPGIMKAKKKPLHTLALSLQEEKIKLTALNPPPKKQEPYMIQGDSPNQVKELIQLLKEKEKIL